MTVLALTSDLGTSLVGGEPQHWPYIEALRKQEGRALGFIPKDRYLSILEKRPSHNRHRHLYESVLLTFDNQDPTGFVYVSWGPRSKAANIYQIVVQEDARRWHRAALMADWITDEAIRRGCEKVTARVAVDLESNAYWQAMGFNIVGQTTSTFLQRTASKSGRPLHQYEKSLTARKSGILAP